MADFEVRVPGNDVRVTEEYDVRAGEDAHDGPEAAVPVPHDDHAVPDRARARELFERLATLPPGSPEREQIRGTLVELHLPLVEYLARRFRNRGEWLDDLTQVATIGLIKSIDRFDLERGVEFSTYATPTIVGEIKLSLTPSASSTKPWRASSTGSPSSPCWNGCPRARRRSSCCGSSAT
jgi:hypothetical protein